MTAGRSTEDGLKPCPFCGGKALLMYGPNYAYNLYEAWVCCKSCGASVRGEDLPMNFYDAEKRCFHTVRRRWNRRAEEGGAE